MAFRLLVLVLLSGLLSCAGSDRAKEETYLRWVAFETLDHVDILLRWPDREMPLKVYLPEPPAELFEDAAAIYDSVRDGVLDWSDVASPGVPSFEFVDRPGEADIPIIWAAEANGAWFIAYCTYDLNIRQRRFGVGAIQVTARWGNGEVADLHDVYSTVLHEMGHALGLGGHSPDRGDILYPRISRHAVEGLSDRDRRTLQALYARPVGSRIGGARRSD